MGAEADIGVDTDTGPVPDGVTAVWPAIIPVADVTAVKGGVGPPWGLLPSAFFRFRAEIEHEKIQQIYMCVKFLPQV